MNGCVRTGPGRGRAWALLLLGMLLAGCGRPSVPPQPAPTSSPAPKAATGGPQPSRDVLTFHGDAARSGWYADEPQLSAAAVRASSFGRRWSAALNGDVYAQPLVVHGVRIGGAARDVVYAVTEADGVYALDAATGSVLWGPVAIGRPVALSSLPCGDIDPVGITSTPVADPASGALYVVGMNAGRYTLAALSLASGAELAGYPVTVDPPASGGTRFDPLVQQQRGALTLRGGRLYIPFGGWYGDCGPYHGWVVAVDPQQPTRQQGFAVPTHREGGIWSPGGVAVDAAGGLYVATGNGDAPSQLDFGDSVLRLTPAPSLGFSRQPRDYFTPSNFGSLNAADADLGSSTPTILPDQAGSATPQLLFVAGKQGVGYLIDRGDMGGLSHGDGVGGEGVWSGCLFGNCRGNRHAVFATAAVWQPAAGGDVLFIAGSGQQPAPCRGTGGVLGMRLATGAGGRAALERMWCSASMGDPASPVVSSSGGAGGLVWLVDTAGPELYALDAASGATAFRARLGGARRFSTPAIADGRVYVPAGRAVEAYGSR